MSDPSQPSLARRVLIALDASSSSLAVLEEAARLAVELRAELQGVFVEDINLLRLASLPFAREIPFSTAAPRQFDVAEMEQSLKVRADRVREALASRANRSRLEWSFQVVRGHVTRASLAAASETDVLIIGCESRRHSPAFSFRRPRRQPLIVIFDGHSSAYRVLETSTQLARPNRDQIVVLIATSNPEHAGNLRHQTDDWFVTRDIRAIIDDTPVGDPETLVAAAGRWQAKLVLINRDSILLSESTVESLVNDADCPVGIVP